MMSVLRAYRRFDIGRIEARDDFRRVAGDHLGEPDSHTTWTLAAGHGLYDEVLACGGWQAERPGVFGLWGYCAGHLTRRDWVTIARETREIIGGLFDIGARRVHALARAGDDKAVAFLLHLGLRNDMNRLTDFGPEGDDYVLLAALARFRS